MAFEKFVPEIDSQAQPKARIRPSGLISFDAVSVEEFGLDDVGHVVLFFDRNKKQIGVRKASSPSEEGAFPVSKRRRSVSVKAPGFFSHYAFVIDRPVVVKVADKDDGMLVLDMKSVKRRRGQRRRTAD